MSSEDKECPLCGSMSYSQTNYEKCLVFYSCPVCGRFELKVLDEGCRSLDYNKTAAYVFYNSFFANSYPPDYRYHTLRTKEECDKYNAEFDKGNNIEGRPVHMDKDIIDTWYPKTFSERVDCILRYLGTHIEHIGQQAIFSYSEMLSLLFIDRKELKESFTRKELVQRDKNSCRSEAKYMLDSLVDAGVIKYNFGSDEDKAVFITLTPKGYSRVDELQKNTSYGRAVLVAMKFGNDTLSLREAIRSGIKKAGYNAIFIDEVQHNDFITPELLKHIRDSKFVVVDLTHQNNGAYFEEGYARGLGKPVIQLCKQDTKLHFDIAQKNTIMWKTEEDIPDRLCNRIKATIE